MNLDTAKTYRLIRFGKATEKDFLSGKFLNTYDIVVFNGNMAIHNRSSISKFLLEKCPEKNFIIDPITHAFQHGREYLKSKNQDDEEELQIKKSILKLIEEYGDVVETALLNQKRTLDISDFVTVANITDFTKKVLLFQKNCFNLKKNGDTEKYIEFLESEGEIESTKRTPAFFISPYFYLDDDLTWLDLNIRFLQETLKQEAKNKSKVAAQLVVDFSQLKSETKRNKIVAAYKKASPATILLWVDNFDEHKASENDLESYIEFVNSLGAFCNVICLYGSFFSVAISRLKICPQLRGITHGMAYGETREVVPVGGGIPVAKFYLPQVFNRLHFRDALRAVRKLGGLDSQDDFFSKICDCAECKSVITSNASESFQFYGETKPGKPKEGKPTREFPTVGTTERCLKHYLHSKEKEYKSKKYLDANLLIQQLETIHKDLKHDLEDKVIGHCLRWKNVLKKKISKKAT